MRAASTFRLQTLAVAAVFAVAAGAVLAAAASADSEPIGPLPKGPVTTVTTPKGTLVAVALPRAKNGLVWRLARRVDSSVLRQMWEADVGGSVVVVFRAKGVGTARVAFAQTRGDSSSNAVGSAISIVRVR